jgi:hypothetical protein
VAKPITSTRKIVFFGIARRKIPATRPAANPINIGLAVTEIKPNKRAKKLANKTNANLNQVF